MTAQERQQKLCDLLVRSQKLNLREMTTALATSPATLRRDLAELEARGALVRVRGGVVHPTYFRREPSLAQKERVAAGEKRAIARAAAGLVHDGATVMIDAGTTCLALGRLLMARPDVTIVTHSLPLAALCCQQEVAARVICVGGEVRGVSGATVGGLAQAWMRSLTADICFVGASGLSPGDGASTTEMGEATAKQQMLERCKRRVLLADHDKWEKPATVTFAAWEQFHIWVTDKMPADAARQWSHSNTDIVVGN